VPARGQRCLRCWSQLAASPIASQRVELAAEPHLPEWVAALLVADPEPMVRMVVAGRADLPSGLLRQLSGDSDPGVRATLAANESLPADVDDRLAADVDADVVIALAARAGLSQPALGRLWHHPDPRVRGAVAGNTSADASLDRALACGEEESVVLAALAAKTTTPHPVLWWLAQHPVRLVAEAAARQLQRHDRTY
jgi:hypothetical protein